MKNEFSDFSQYTILGGQAVKIAMKSPRPNSNATYRYQQSAVESESEEFYAAPPQSVRKSNVTDGNADFRDKEVLQLRAALRKAEETVIRQAEELEVQARRISYLESLLAASECQEEIERKGKSVRIPDQEVERKGKSAKVPDQASPPPITRSTEQQSQSHSLLQPPNDGMGAKADKTSNPLQTRLMMSVEERRAGQPTKTSKDSHPQAAVVSKKKERESDNISPSSQQENKRPNLGQEKEPTLPMPTANTTSKIATGRFKVSNAGGVTLYIMHDTAMQSEVVAHSIVANGPMHVMLESHANKTDARIVVGSIVYAGPLDGVEGACLRGVRGAECLVVTNLRYVQCDLNTLPRRNSAAKPEIVEIDLGGLVNVPSETALRDFLRVCTSRVDVMLDPYCSDPMRWFPYFEGRRKMAPQFRSRGIGYIRLGDDMSNFGTAFLSLDAGRSYLDGNQAKNLLDNTVSAASLTLTEDMLDPSASAVSTFDGNTPFRRRNNANGGLTDTIRKLVRSSREEVDDDYARLSAEDTTTNNGSLKVMSLSRCSSFQQTQASSPLPSPTDAIASLVAAALSNLGAKWQERLGGLEAVRQAMDGMGSGSGVGSAVDAMLEAPTSHSPRAHTQPLCDLLKLLAALFAPVTNTSSNPQLALLGLQMIEKHLCTSIRLLIATQSEPTLNAALQTLLAELVSHALLLPSKGCPSATVMQQKKLSDQAAACLSALHTRCLLGWTESIALLQPLLVSGASLVTHAYRGLQWVAQLVLSDVSMHCLRRSTASSSRDSPAPASRPSSPSTAILSTASLKVLIDMAARALGMREEANREAASRLISTLAVMDRFVTMDLAAVGPQIASHSAEDAYWTSYSESLFVSDWEGLIRSADLRSLVVPSSSAPHAAVLSRIKPKLLAYMRGDALAVLRAWAAESLKQSGLSAANPSNGSSIRRSSSRSKLKSKLSFTVTVSTAAAGGSSSSTMMPPVQQLQRQHSDSDASSSVASPRSLVSQTSPRPVASPRVHPQRSLPASLASDWASLRLLLKAVPQSAAAWRQTVDTIDTSAAVFAELETLCSVTSDGSSKKMMTRAQQQAVGLALRVLLPFDEHTNSGDQADVRPVDGALLHAQLVKALSQQASSGRGPAGAAQLVDLQARLQSIRRTVRVKLADGNDYLQGKEALSSLVAFLGQVREHADGSEDIVSTLMRLDTAAR